MFSIAYDRLTHTLTLGSYQALNWLFLFLCVAAFSARSYVRYACFRRLLFEDYLMLFALALHTAEAILIQLYVQHVYEMEAVGKGDSSKITPDFMPNSKQGFIAVGTSINLTIIGVLIVKLNFLLFFRRLGKKLNRFNIAWWTILTFTIAVTIAQIAMQRFGFIALPVVILWKSRISKRKKFVLSLVFGLVFLTMAITIVRGSVFHDVYDNAGKKGGRMQSATFTWFWFYCEFTPFLIACIVSFRTLFVQQRNESQEREQKQQRRQQLYNSAIQRGLRFRARQMHDSLLDTCKTLEGVSQSDDEKSMHGLPSVPTGLMTVNFEDDSSWRKTATTTLHSNDTDRTSV
ncbi:hypothetical protein GQ44DRAFT_783537 [Phaeosphaeriaceae sp. PMI808]|nr:hypothetical protein GQ44DRAFT_783537 [Phaeosphaeriaceae sp. PMI808]